MTHGRRILANTAAMYVRVLVSGALGLIGSRFVFAALGVVDYGLYNVVAGITGFMAFINNAMAMSSQRSLSHALGRRDVQLLRSSFRSCLQIHLGLALLLVLIGETLGLWFLRDVLSIQESRREAAFWVYQFTVFSLGFSVALLPYQALLNAHEALVAVSVIGVLQSLCMFVVSLVLVRVHHDQLVVYGLLSALISVTVLLSQVGLCRLRYPECRGRLLLAIDKGEALNVAAISGWNLIGSLSVVCRVQGIAFLLNVFFGAVANAAYGIAIQVCSVALQLTQSMQQALTPRLIKQEGAGDRRGLLESSLLSCRFGFFLACLWVVPLFVELPMLLTLWLRHPPDHAATFSRIMLLIFLCDQLSSGFGVVVLAIGRVAAYQSVVGAINLVTLPLAYLALKAGFQENAVLVCSLLTTCVAVSVRGIVVERIAGLNYGSWLRGVVFRGFAGISPGVAVAWVTGTYLEQTYVRGLLVLALTSVFLLAGVWVFGVTAGDRVRLRALLQMTAPSSSERRWH